MKLAAKKNYGELGVSIGMTILAIIFIALSDYQQTLNPVDPGPAMFPRLAGAFTIILCAIQIISSLREKVGSKEKSEENSSSAKLKVLYVLGTLAITIVYIVLFEQVKYIILTGVFLAAVMFLLGIRKWTVLASVAVLYALLSYFLYGKVLMVPLS